MVIILILVLKVVLSAFVKFVYFLLATSNPNAVKASKIPLAIPFISFCKFTFVIFAPLAVNAPIISELEID